MCSARLKFSIGLGGDVSEEFQEQRYLDGRLFPEPWQILPNHGAAWLNSARLGGGCQSLQIVRPIRRSDRVAVNQRNSRMTVPSHPLKQRSAAHQYA